jgi:hypothetical protein
MTAFFLKVYRDLFPVYTKNNFKLCKVKSHFKNLFYLVSGIKVLLYVS